MFRRNLIKISIFLALVVAGIIAFDGHEESINVEKNMTGHTKPEAHTTSIIPTTESERVVENNCNPLQEVCTQTQRNYFAEERFKKSIQNYFDGYADLTSQERQMKVDTYMLDINKRETNRTLSAMEGVTLKLALLKTLGLDSEVHKLAAKKLIQKYEKEYDHAMQQHEDKPDPRFVTYKQREKEIVQKIMAMQSFPNGLSRDAYLRQQLDALRSELYK